MQTARCDIVVYAHVPVLDWYITRLVPVFALCTNYLWYITQKTVIITLCTNRVGDLGVHDFYTMAEFQGFLDVGDWYISAYKPDFVLCTNPNGTKRKNGPETAYVPLFSGT